MAVAREVKEESGIDVDPQTICYEASQPWPFPQSLMIGFQAQAAHSRDTAKREAELRQLKVGSLTLHASSGQRVWTRCHPLVCACPCKISPAPKGYSHLAVRSPILALFSMAQELLSGQNGAALPPDCSSLPISCC